MRPPPSLHVVLALPLLVLLGGVLAGCGAPPAPPENPPPPAAAPTAALPSPLPVPSMPPLPPQATATSGFADDRPVSCGGEPGGDEIIALLRDQDLLTAEVDASVAEGPLCAGTWQYAVISVPDLDPLQVVTQGEPGDLDLVTAGTDVCTVEVRVQAPSGIRVAADCVG